jgi:hypothetical protein
MNIGPGFREEVLNIELARLLHHYGLVALPEVIQHAGAARHLPDVVVSFYGLRLVIEGKVNDGPHAAEEALRQARQRLEHGIAQVVLAVLYPPHLRTASFSDLSEHLEHATLQVSVISEADTAGDGWIALAGAAQLADHLRRVHERLTGEDVVAAAAADVAEAVSRFEAALAPDPAAAERIAEVMEVGEPDADSDTD